MPIKSTVEERLKRMPRWRACRYSFSDGYQDRRGGGRSPVQMTLRRDTIDGMCNEGCVQGDEIICDNDDKPCCEIFVTVEGVKG